MTGTVAARESARLGDGRFGVQERSESGVPLTVVAQDQVSSGVQEGVEWRESETQRGNFREAIVDGRPVASVTFVVFGEDTDGYAERENAVVVEYMITDPDYRGRGLNRALLGSIVEEHPDKTFYTENFERPTARRSWEDVVGGANGMESDGEYGCAWCCVGLGGYDDTMSESVLCGNCEIRNEHHEAGEHDSAPQAACWACDDE